VKIIEIDSDLVLKPIKRQYSKELFKLIEGNRTYLREWLGWLDRTISISDSERFIDSCVAAAQENKGHCFLMWSNEVIVGIIDLVDIDHLNKKASIGYWIGQEYRGNGFARRSTVSIVDFALGELKLNRIEIRCATGNTASQSIPLNLGFKKEGILRENELLYDRFVDHIVFSTNRNEWTRSPAS